MAETVTSDEMTNDWDSDWRQIDQLMRLASNEMTND